MKGSDLEVHAIASEELVKDIDYVSSYSINIASYSMCQ